jgi:amylosucrase
MSGIRSTPERRERAAHAASRLLPELRPTVEQALGRLEGGAFLARLEVSFPDLFEALDVLYADRVDPCGLLAELAGRCLSAAERRPEELRLLDRRREVDPAWFQRARVCGYVAYADRFAGDLPGVADHLDYLAELGVNYLHLMPLLRPRPGPNDGGYAVADYRQVDPRLGSMDDLVDLGRALHGRGMALCIDLVLNHTAAEHEWARRAVAGEAAYRDYYLVFPDRTLPDAYEATLPEVFPDFAPGSFTASPELGGWVWTTFNSWQWDLDWSNPAVFGAMLDVMLDLAGHGVDVFRLDAVPFLWKRMGTDCQNQPEAHLILQALRALVRLAAPGVVLKAEAIVGPEKLVQYLGDHESYRPECDLAYNNQLMVQLWSSLAARDGRLITTAMSRMRQAPPQTGWVTYLRGHDDIGWAISDADAAAVGWDGASHRRFLTNFYAGHFPGSFARGEPFQFNPATSDARTSGSAASLCGLELALAQDDAAGIDAAIRRICLLYSVVFSYGGIPLLWMGDELGLLNDSSWADDPETDGDNRWMHRPKMDWALAERRTDPTSVQGRIFAALRDLATARSHQEPLRAGGESTPLPVDNPHVFAYRRRHQRSRPLLALVNFSDQPQSVGVDLLITEGLHVPAVAHASDPVDVLPVLGGRVVIPGLGFLWVVDD